MVRMLFTYEVMEPSVGLSLPFFERISQKYNIELRKKSVRDVTNKDIEWCDIIYCIRGQSYLSSEVLRLGKVANRLIVCMYDDDFLSLEDFMIRRKLQMKAIRKNIQYSNALFSGNDTLAKKLREINKQMTYVRIDTPVKEEEFNVKRDFKAKSVLKVVYYVNDGSVNDFDNVIRNAIMELDLETRQCIDWTFLVVKPDLKGLVNDNLVHYIPRMSLSEFKKYLSQGEFDVGIAPLVEGDFTSCKYINKYIEYTLAGIPCIYSKVEPYESFVKHGIDGLLCENTPKAWIDALNKMKNEKFRKECVMNAQQRLLEDFGLDELIERTVQQYPLLVTYQAPHGKKVKGVMKAKVMNKVVIVFDYIGRASVRIRKDGIISLFKLVWGHYILGRDYNKIFKEQKK